MLAVAAALQNAGVGSGDVVAVLGPKGAEQIPALLGILTAGAAYLPIGVDQPADRARRMLATGGVTFALICGADTPEVLAEAAVPSLRIRDIDTSATTFTPVTVAPDDLAYVLFTSGSTGEPKGVELTHDAVLNTLEFLYRHFEIGASDRGAGAVAPGIGHVGAGCVRHPARRWRHRHGGRGRSAATRTPGPGSSPSTGSRWSTSCPAGCRCSPRCPATSARCGWC